MENIFLEKWYTKCGSETIPGPFSKKAKILYRAFIAKLRAIEIYRPLLVRLRLLHEILGDVCIVSIVIVW